MRIITWNVVRPPCNFFSLSSAQLTNSQLQNALRTVLPYKPWNELADRSIKGMLDTMQAEIVCFQGE